MTLGVSPAVNSCSDPFVAAISWFLVLSSRRKSPPRIESSLYYSCIVVCPYQASSAAWPSAPFRRALAASVQPVFKILDLHNMRNFRMPDLHRNGGQSSSDIADPVMAARAAWRGPGQWLRRGIRPSRQAVWFSSWTTTVQALRATMAICHFRSFFAN